MHLKNYHPVAHTPIIMMSLEASYETHKDQTPHLTKLHTCILWLRIIIIAVLLTFVLTDAINFTMAIFCDNLKSFAGLLSFCMVSRLTISTDLFWRTGILFHYTGTYGEEVSWDAFHWNTEPYLCASGAMEHYSLNHERSSIQHSSISRLNVPNSII